MLCNYLVYYLICHLIFHAFSWSFNYMEGLPFKKKPHISSNKFWAFLIFFLFWSFIKFTWKKLVLGPHTEITGFSNLKIVSHYVIALELLNLKQKYFLTCLKHKMVILFLSCVKLYTKFFCPDLVALRRLWKVDLCGPISRFFCEVKTWTCAESDTGLDT